MDGIARQLNGEYRDAHWRGKGNSLREMGRVSFSFIHFGGLSKVCQLVYQEIGLRFLLAASSRLKLINFLLHRLKEMSLGPPFAYFRFLAAEIRFWLIIH